MKTAFLIASVLGATQCLPAEPSGNPTSATTNATTSAPAPVTAEQAAPASAPAPEPSARDLSWLTPGPPPFTVPTERIELGELRATMIVPRGAQVVRTDSGTLVTLGEGKNYAMLVSSDGAALGDTADRVGSELADGEPRDDGAVVWQDDGWWRFEMRAALTCWNREGSRHGADDVETMIASCLSVEESK